MKRALFVSHRIPYPPDKGDKIRSFRILRRLAERFDVDLCAFVDDRDDFQHEAALREICASVALSPLPALAAKARSLRGFVERSPLSMAYYNDARMRAAVAGAGGSAPALKFAFSSTMAPYILNDPRSGARVVDLCDADAEKWRAYAAEAGLPMRAVYAREARLLAREETAIANAADAAFAISPEEAAVFNGRPGVRKKVDWFGNGVDAEFFDPGADFRAVFETPEIVFVGALDYKPNADAAVWFVEKVWPRIKAAAPSVRFAAIGPRPTKAVEALASVDGVAVTGRVDDVRPYIAKARAVVAPLRIARGVQNKVLEAMAMSAGLVATSAALEGVDAEPDRHLLVADAPAEFADAVLRLVNDAALRGRLGAAARQQIVERYAWPAQLARLDRRIDALMS